MPSLFLQRSSKVIPSFRPFWNNAPNIDLPVFCSFLQYHNRQQIILCEFLKRNCFGYLRASASFFFRNMFTKGFIKSYLVDFRVLGSNRRFSSRLSTNFNRYGFRLREFNYVHFQKQNDLELAVQIGKSLLDRNRDLDRQLRESEQQVATAMETVCSWSDCKTYNFYCI